MLATTRLRAIVVGTMAACALVAKPAASQTFEALGTRAQGMGGAFVAVADDPTAVYWNPAGLAVGPLFGFAVEGSALESGAEDDDRKAGAPGATVSSRLIAVASMPLAAAYYRVETLAAPAAAEGRDRTVTSFAADHLAGTLVQSLGDHLAVGASLKFVRGGVASGLAPSGIDPIDVAEGLDREASDAFDMDLGAMMTIGRARVGLTARNLLEPDFEGSAGERVTLERQVRAGFAILPREGVVVAVDADLSTVQSGGGDRRQVAVGAETWWANGRVGLRGGLRVSTTGESRLAGAGGVSLGIVRGFWVDGQVTRGGDEADRGWSWGLGGRFGL